MSSRFHVKKGDEVVAISGSEKGRRGKILAIQAAKGRVVVEGLNIVKRHTRKSRAHPEGAIVTRESSMHLSNVMLASRYDERRGAGAAETKG